ncbi:hypothetical protein JPSP28_21120 [Staphylococcus pseudintermedius]
MRQKTAYYIYIVLEGGIITYYYLFLLLILLSKYDATNATNNLKPFIINGYKCCINVLHQKKFNATLATVPV